MTLDTVLVVGSGGREHALAVALAASPLVRHVLVCPGNGGTASYGGKLANVSAPESKPTLKENIRDLAQERKAGLVVVGPEVPLVDGLADLLQESNIPCFGPSAAAAQLEGSKAFSKEFMKRHNIPTAAFATFNDTQVSEAQQFISNAGYDVVLKASGLAAGKGVLVPASKDEAREAIGPHLKSHGVVVVEERLTGKEVSCLVLVDGTRYAICPLSQDHKRIGDLDRGLNTGGMGAFCPVPGVTEEQMSQIEANLVSRTVAGLAADGTPFRGCLYIGAMLTPTGPQVIEYNCRFGDPETQVVLPLLKSDFAVVAMSCAQGTLDPGAVTWRNDQFACTVVAASGGYPGSYNKGHAITGVDQAMKSSFVYQAGTKQSNGQLVTSGGRVLAVTGQGASLEQAAAAAYEGMSKIKFEGLTYRTDIAAKSFKPVNIAVLGSTRGTDMQAIIDAIATGTLQAKITHVISNKSSAFILERASNHGIPATCIASKGKSREQFDEEVIATLEADPSKAPDLVLLIGFMRILSPVLVQKYAGRMLNVHPSLLPDFAGGMDTNVHEAVLKAGREFSGCTVHQVTEDVDSGAIAVQKQCDISSDETVDTLKVKVQRLEGDALIQSVHLFQLGRLPGLNPQKNSSTYAAAGVDIDAGNALVDKIKPFTRATKRPGADGSLGGFGALFDLAAAGYGTDAPDSPDRPLLVSATDGVGTKLRIAQDCNKHDTIGIDLVAMCVNDLVVQGAEPLFFLDYFASGTFAGDLSTCLTRDQASLMLIQLQVW